MTKRAQSLPDDAAGGQAQPDKGEAPASKPAEAKAAKARQKPKQPTQASSAAR